ncbi:MAG: hypothetical protein DRG39_01465 [Deltaproteobacteria bacterium]|nr:MAG: hypothetical protein DRG39_01465 [Deltaproteobacteria bacterium]
MGKNIKLYLFIFFLIACAHPSYYLDKNEVHKIKKVAIFPFHNLSKTPQAREIVTQIFLAELTKANLFNIEELGNIIDFMVEKRLRIGASLDKASLLLLRRRYKVDAIILGDILVFDERGGVPYLNLTARMVSTDTGKIIWKASIERNGEDYIKVLNIGRISSLNQLTQRVIKELIETMS